MVVAAATIEFARGGYAGTSTDAIARRVGVSQPYLFQLFGTKKELFIAVTGAASSGPVRCSRQRAGRRGARAHGQRPRWSCTRWASTYQDHLAIAICCGSSSTPTRPAATRRSATSSATSSRLYREVARLSGAEEIALQPWFAYGMLCNVATAIGLSHEAVVPARWRQHLTRARRPLFSA